MKESSIQLKPNGFFSKLVGHPIRTNRAIPTYRSLHAVYSANTSTSFSHSSVDFLAKVTEQHTIFSLAYVRVYTDRQTEVHLGMSE